MKYKTLKHFNNPGHIHELTFSCLHKQSLFNSDKICQIFIDSLSDARNKHSFYLLAYVVMPNHVHLLIYPKVSEYSISRILSGTKLSFSLRLLKSGLKPEGSFWQRGGGYDRNIITLKTIRAVINYIHNNPVRKGLVKTPEEWKWSSAGYYAGADDYPIKIDDEAFKILF